MFRRPDGPLKGKLRIDIPSVFVQTAPMLGLREFARAYPASKWFLGKLIAL